MRRLLLSFVALLPSGSVLAQEYDAVIRVPQVEVRSLPSAKKYGTGVLRKGQAVRVKSSQGDYLAIVPPADAFSVVPKQALELLPGQQGLVRGAAVETYVGSVLVNDCDVRGTRLQPGSQVQILDEIMAPTASGLAPFYRIVPLNEVRYIPADAIRDGGVVQAGGAGSTARGGVQPAGGNARQGSKIARDELGRWSNDAEMAYKKGEATGNFAEAKRLYDELARCDDIEFRQLAENRLLFIRRRAPGLFAKDGGNQAAQPAQPAYYGSSNGGRGNSGTGGTFRPPAEPAPPPANSSRFSPLNSPKGNLRSGTSGWLKKAVTREQGRQVYYVVDDQGKTRFYVAPATNVDLESHVEQKVDITGGPMVYRHDLKGNYMVAVAVKKLP